jgi:group II intron reverse transcriptase/maturase
MDIEGFFDNIPHDLLMRALQHHVKEKWVLLYVERWLTAPVQMPDGNVEERTKGTPQGGVISPLLANLFLHYTFDKWMERNYPDIPFERYADDGICHCKTREEAERLKELLETRFMECGLELNKEKTKIVYCRDSDRKGDYPVTSFDFLGYTFRARCSMNRWGKFFINFSPAMSKKAGKRIREEIRSWNLNNRSDKSLEDLARMFNAKIRGWINYYGAYYKSQMYPTLRQIDRKLVLWATRKYKKLRRHKRRASHMLNRIAMQQVELFAHWPLLHGQGRIGRAG